MKEFQQFLVAQIYPADMQTKQKKFKTIKTKINKTKTEVKET